MFKRGCIIQTLSFMVLAFNISAVAATKSPQTSAKTPASPAPSVVKTNICSITINSNDEIETFKSQIGEKNANFIELTTLPSDDEGGDEGENKSTAESEDVDPHADSFLKRACKKQIKCDVLIVSGHFGGSFFGSSGLNLSMEELEQRACDKACDGILQSPKEVYLFGCNTLAGKKQDHRSPEEYRRVLMADGFSNEQAEQVVAFRYSPLGDAFSDRMRRVFRNTPRIYGFDSVGPSGKNVRGLLKSYFTAIKGKDYYGPANLRKLDESVNGELAKALKVTALAQAAGAKEMTREQIPACFLNNQKVGFYSKLNWISKSLNSEKAFSYLPAINDYLTRLTVENYQWKDKEFEVIENVMGNHKLRDSLGAIVQRRDSAILGMQLKILTFMKFFGWVYNKDYMKRVETLLVGDLNRDIDVEGKDQICSYGSSNSLKVDFPPSEVPAARWKDPEFVDVLGCVGTFNEAVLEKAVQEYLQAPEKTELKNKYISYLKGAKVPIEAAPTFYRALLPGGDDVLSASTKDILCSSWSNLRALWDHRLAAPREGLNYAQYVEDAGCYLNFNEDDILSLISSAHKDPKLKEAIVNSLNYQNYSAEEVVLSDASQDRLMDFMLSLKDDQQVRMSGYWSRIKKLSPSVQNRMQGTLVQYATQPWREAMSFPEQILQKALKAEAYCPFTLNRVSSSAQTKNWQTTLNIMNSYLDICYKSWNSDSYSSVIQPGSEQLFKSLASKIVSNLAPATDEELDNVFGYSVESLITLIAEMKIAPKNLQELRVLFKLNDATYVGRRGAAVYQEDLIALYQNKNLPKEAIQLWNSSRKEDKEFALRIWKSRDMNDAESIQILAKLYKSGGDSETDAIIALAEQDETAAAKLWLEKFLKNWKNQSDYTQVGYGTIFESNSEMIRLLKEGLHAKKISEDVGAQLLVMAAGYADSGGDFNATRTWIRAFAQEFKSYKKIQNAVAPAINASRDRERECEDYPRACYGGDAG